MIAKKEVDSKIHIHYFSADGRCENPMEEASHPKKLMVWAENADHFSAGGHIEIWAYDIRPIDEYPSSISAAKKLLARVRAFARHRLEEETGN